MRYAGVARVAGLALLVSRQPNPLFRASFALGGVLIVALLFTVVRPLNVFCVTPLSNVVPELQSRANAPLTAPSKTNVPPVLTDKS